MDANENLDVLIDLWPSLDAEKRQCSQCNEKHNTDYLLIVQKWCQRYMEALYETKDPSAGYFIGTMLTRAMKNGLNHALTVKLNFNKFLESKDPSSYEYQLLKGIFYIVDCASKGDFVCPVGLVSLRTEFKTFRFLPEKTEKLQ